jgi:hypothetical protein
MKILFEDGVYENVDVSEISRGVVRLDETPIASSAELRFGDVIEVEQGEQGVWRFLRLSKRANHESASVLISREIAGSTELQTVLSQITQLGVHWERAFGGILFLHGSAEQIGKAQLLLESLVARG